MKLRKPERLLPGWTLLVAATGIVAGTMGSPSAVAGPIPGGWTCNGNCGTGGADGVVTLSPTGNSFYAWISTSSGPTGVGEIPGAGGTNGSIIMTPVFYADADSPLQFYFNYVTSDGAQYTDYAWAALYTSTNSLVAYMFTARTEPSGSIVPGVGLPANGATLTPASVPIILGGPMWSPLDGYSGSCYSAGCGYTGWIQSDYTIDSAGSYYLVAGVTNFLDNGYDSGLALGGVSISGHPIPTQVPEPGSLLLSVTGLAGVSLGMLARRRQASSSP